jgi:protein-tyrosine phosphatase
MKIEVLSHYLFEEKCKEDGLNDENVEDKKDKAFIDIIGTEECRKYYLMEEMQHYFNNFSNVLNLEFDDLSQDVAYDGHIFKAMTMEQAEKTVDFIEKMINNGVIYFRICCRAGYSRSRAVAEFIYRYCVEHHIEVEYADRNDYSTFLNQGVLRKLNNAYWKKHKENGYDEEGRGYPEDLLDHTPRHVEVD